MTSRIRPKKKSRSEFNETTRGPKKSQMQADTIKNV